VRRNSVRLKRAYDESSPADGQRVLVERLWPRGLTKARAAVDFWHKDVAPSPELRRWFGHDPVKWPEFRRRYIKELRQNPQAVELLRQKAKHGVLTLVYAARDEGHNSAAVLKDYLES
jgi:uncharacterized protein YeaO (DUF488 family)